MHKKQYTQQALAIVDDAILVANHLGEDGEDEIDEAIARPLVARSLKRIRCQVIADAIGVEPEDVKDALAELKAAETADATEEVADAA